MRLLFFLLLVFYSRSLWAETARPNIVVLVSDDQRPDTIGALGNRHIRTPHLDRLAREGSTFTRAICGNPICTPSRAEILTGCGGFHNGVLDFGGQFAEGLTMWAQAFQEAGYHTCYVGKWHNKGRPSQHGYQESRGLYSGGGGRWWKGQKDHYGREVTGYRGWVFQTDDRRFFPEKGVGLTADISARFADAAIGLIEAPPTGKPFFLHVNFTAPHDPLLLPTGYEKAYDPAKIPLPKNFLARHPFDHGNFEGRDEKLFQWPRTKRETQAELAAYYAVISHLDEQVGRIMRALKKSGQEKNTLIVYASDHGLAVGSHGLRGKQSMYEHTIGVPMILRGPQVPADRRFAAQAYLRDLYPTTCELAGVPIPGSVRGKSLAGVLRGETKEVHPYVFGYFRNYQRMIRGKRWKLIDYPHLQRQQLFDLENDPYELTDLSEISQHAGIKKELQAKLRAWREEVGDPSLRQKD